MRRFMLLVLFAMFLCCSRHPATAQSLDITDITIPGGPAVGTTPPGAVVWMETVDRFEIPCDADQGGIFAPAWQTHHAPDMMDMSSLQDVGSDGAAAPVPEPASILLVGSGFLLVGGLWKRHLQQMRK